MKLVVFVVYYGTYASPRKIYGDCFMEAEIGVGFGLRRFNDLKKYSPFVLFADHYCCSELEFVNDFFFLLFNVSL